MNKLKKIISKIKSKIFKKHVLAYFEEDVYIRNGLSYVLSSIYPIEKNIFYNIKIDTLDIILNLLFENNAVFIDIGANMGSISIPVGQKLYKLNGKMFLFEPNNVIRNRLIKNIDINKKIICETIVEPYAIGSFEREMFIVEDDANRGNSGLITKMESGNNLELANKCKIIALNDYINNLERCDLIKIDVEGFEYDCLEGANLLIDKFRPTIIFEVWDIEELRYLTIIDMRSLIFDFFNFHNYRIYKPTKFGYKTCLDPDSIFGDCIAMPIEKQNIIAYNLDIRNNSN